MNMKHALTQIAGILGIAIVSVASNALAQTTAPGPYYATPSWDQQLPASSCCQTGEAQRFWTVRPGWSGKDHRAPQVATGLQPKPAVSIWKWVVGQAGGSLQSKN
jgi:hypothetical protein